MFIGYDWGATFQAPPDAGVKGGNQVAKPSVHNHVIQVIQEMKREWRKATKLSKRTAAILPSPWSRTQWS